MGLPSDIEINLVDSIDKAWEMKRWASERRPVMGLDTETSGLSPYAHDIVTGRPPRLRTIQLGDFKAGWTVPWDQWGGVAMELLNQYDGTIAAHNWAFDCKWMTRHTDLKVPWDRIHDTMIMSNMIYPGKPAGLKDLSDKYVDSRASFGQEVLKRAFVDNGWTWDTVPIDYPTFWQYAAIDPIITCYIWEHLRADQAYPDSFDLEMSALRICVGMEDRGIPIDLDYVVQQKEALEEWADSTRKWATDNLGINIASTSQLSKYFLSLGAPVHAKTASGAPSMDKKALDLYALDSNPQVAGTANLVIQLRKYEKIRSSYFDNFLRYSVDGLMHPSIKTMQAVTGRMSITNPAMQTLHKDDKLVRGSVRPREGHVLISSDLDQVEFRIFAHLSQDEQLIDTFLTADRTGSDAFTEIGKQVYKDPSFDKEDKRRRLVKGVVYGMLYGAGVKKMAETSGTPEQDMKEVHDALLKAYPGIKVYQDEAALEVEARAKASSDDFGFIETRVTKRRIPVEGEFAYRGVNYTIQSTAAEVFKRNLVKIDNAGLGEYMLIPVHDEIILSVPKEMAIEAKETLKELMTTTDGWSVPLTSGSDGPFDRWGGPEIDF